MGAEEARARLLGPMQRTETPRSGVHGKWAWGFMAGVGLGVSRAWCTEARFQAGKHLGGRQRAQMPGKVVNPRMAGRRKEGPVLLPDLRLPCGLLASHLPAREFVTARITSREGAWELAGQPVHV